MHIVYILYLTYLQYVNDIIVLVRENESSDVAVALEISEYRRVALLDAPEFVENEFVKFRHERRAHGV